MIKRKEWKSMTQKEKIVLACSILFFVIMMGLFVYSIRDDSLGYTEKKGLSPYRIEERHDYESYSEYEVRIKTKLSEKEIAAIADQIKRDSPPGKWVSVFYYLPCMTVGGGAWATSMFIDDLKVTIQDYEYILTINPPCINKAK